MWSNNQTETLLQSIMERNNFEERTSNVKENLKADDKCYKHYNNTLSFNRKRSRSRSKSPLWDKTLSNSKQSGSKKYDPFEEQTILSKTSFSPGSERTILNLTRDKNGFTPKKGDKIPKQSEIEKYPSDKKWCSTQENDTNSSNIDLLYNYFEDDYENVNLTPFLRENGAQNSINNIPVLETNYTSEVSANNSLWGSTIYNMSNFINARPEPNRNNGLSETNQYYQEQFAPNNQFCETIPNSQGGLLCSAVEPTQNYGFLGTNHDVHEDSVTHATKRPKLILVNRKFIKPSDKSDEIKSSTKNTVLETKTIENRQSIKKSKSNTTKNIVSETQKGSKLVLTDILKEIAFYDLNVIEIWDPFLKKMENYISYCKKNGTLGKDPTAGQLKRGQRRLLKKFCNREIIVKKYGEDFFYEITGYPKPKPNYTPQKPNPPKPKKWDRYVIVAIHSEKFPQYSITKMQLAIIKDYLMTKHKEAKEELNFDNIIFQSGVLYIQCVDESTAQWFRNVVENFPPIRGQIIKTSTPKDTKLVKINVDIPNLPATDFLNQLAQQNPEISIKNWKILREATLPKLGDKVRLLIDMSENCWDELTLTEKVRIRTLIFNSEKLEFRILDKGEVLKNYGKYIAREKGPTIIYSSKKKMASRMSIEV